MNDNSDKKKQDSSQLATAKADNVKADINAAGIPATIVKENVKENAKGNQKDNKNKSGNDLPKNKDKPVKAKQPLSKTAVFALLLTLLLGAALGYGFFLLQRQDLTMAQFVRSQENSNALITRLEQEIRLAKNSLSEESHDRKRLEAEFVEFKVAMEAVASKFGRTSNEWRLAEVEYLLAIANHRLTLAQDRITAMAIFETADQRLNFLGDPALLKIRKLLKEELSALQKVEEPDIDGMLLTMGGLIAEVDHFPLIDIERVAVATGQIENRAPDSWKDIPAAVWKDIKSLVVVRRHEQPTEPLLPPDESWYLSQNLRLKLEQARLALLQRDTALFRQHLKEADGWMNSFFNKESLLVENTLKKTSALAKIELAPVFPDVSSSLRELRQLLIERGVKIGK